MEYNAIFTHNPQDFFTGDEPEELIIFEKLNADDLHKVFEYADNGYYAIISKSREAGECRTES